MKRSGFLIGLLLLAAPAMGLDLGVDTDGNGRWDDLDHAVASIRDIDPVAVDYLATSMQKFVESPAGNQSLALQAMTNVQSAVLCVYWSGGPERGRKAIDILTGTIRRDPARSGRFRENEQLIQGRELPFEQDPDKWAQYCPQR